MLNMYIQTNVVPNGNTYIEVPTPITERKMAALPKWIKTQAHQRCSPQLRLARLKVQLEVEAS